MLKTHSTNMCIYTHTHMCRVTDLVQLIGTLPAEVVLTGQDDHRFAEELQTDGTDQLFLQRCQRRLALHPPGGLQAARLSPLVQLHLLLLAPQLIECTQCRLLFDFYFLPGRHFFD